MYPVSFKFYSPSTLDEALKLLSEYREDAKVLAGGHSLIPLMKLRLATPKHVIYLGGIRELEYIKESDGEILLGALTRHNDVENSPVVRSKCPLLSETASRIGDLQVRNMGTIGGSLAHADPAADYPAAVLALEGEIVARRIGGSRTIKAHEFFRGAFETALSPDELITEVRVPVLQGRYGSAYEKIASKANDYAIAGAAALIVLDEEGKCVKARVGLTGVFRTPVRARGVEEELEGKKLSEDVIMNASKRASEGPEPLSDVKASSDYRRYLATVATKRALLRAFSQATRKG